MTRAAAIAAAIAIALSARAGAQAPPSTAADLVGTWTLARIETGIDRDKPMVVPNPRGLLVFDAAGHAFEVVTRANRQLPPLSDAQATFATYTGFWGTYRADPAAGRLTFSSRGAFSPSMMGVGHARTFALRGDRLVVTSEPGEPHTQGPTRWTWERVPVVDHLSDTYRKVIGFWEHVVEKRFDPATGAGDETRRAPSVIVYTPSGYVGVHFPPLNRQPFAAAEPTDAEARAAMRGYIGYYGALGVYPGMVFHQILAGISPAGGNTLKRTFELSGSELTIRFTPLAGGEQATLVTLRRLSGETDMLPPGRR